MCVEFIEYNENLYQKWWLYIRYHLIYLIEITSTNDTFLLTFSFETFGTRFLLGGIAFSSVKIKANLGFAHGIIFFNSHMDRTITQAICDASAIE